MKKSRVILVVALVLMMVALPLLGACTKEVVKEVPVEKVVEKTVTKEVRAQKIGIGVSIPLTGALAGLGMANERALRMAEAKINSEGIQVGGVRYEFLFIIEDDAMTADRAAANANKFLYTDKLNIVIVFAFASVQGAAPLLEGKDVLFFAQGSPGGISPKNPNAFRLMQATAEYAGAYVKWVKDNSPEIKKIFVILPDDASGTEVSNNYAKAFAYYGMTVAGVERHPRTLTEYSPIIGKALATNPDAILMTASGPTGNLLKQLREKGYKGQVLAVSNVDNDFVKLVGTAMEGVLSVTPDPESPLIPQGVRDFSKEYKGKYGADPTSYAMDFYNIPLILADAMKKAGSVEIKKLVEVMATQELDSLWGKFRFAGKEVYGIDRQAYFPTPVSKYQGGKFNVVYLISSDEEIASYRLLYGK